MSVKAEGEGDPPLKILIVEDELLLAMDLESHLVALGQNVLGIAPDAEQAFGLAAKASPDLALVDLNLNDGLTGPQIASKLSSAHDSSVVFVTGNPEQIPVDYAGALGSITKPWEPKTIEHLVAFVRSLRAETLGPSSRAPPHMTLAPTFRDPKLGRTSGRS